jgi:hypothetical protein
MIIECEVVGGRRISRGSQSTQRKPDPVPLGTAVFCSGIMLI